MKKIITLFSMAVLLCIAPSVFSQEKNQDITVKANKVTIDGQTKFSCREVVFNSDKELLTMTGDVSVNGERLQLENAGKVIWDKKLNKITAYDVKKFTVTGKVIMTESAGKKNILEYTIGDDKAYIF